MAFKKNGRGRQELLSTKSKYIRIENIIIYGQMRSKEIKGEGYEERGEVSVYNTNNLNVMLPP